VEDSSSRFRDIPATGNQQLCFQKTRADTHSQQQLELGARERERGRESNPNSGVLKEGKERKREL
jgi:hypothetical protein